MRHPSRSNAHTRRYPTLASSVFMMNAYARPSSRSCCSPMISLRRECLTICKASLGTRAMCQEDKDMADQNEAKTKTIGFLPKEKVQTLKGWDEYVDKSTKLSVLRTEAQKAKNSVR